MKLHAATIEKKYNHGFAQLDEMCSVRSNRPRVSFSLLVVVGAVRTCVPAAPFVVEKGQRYMYYG
jgi:hypothetical protein